jgi:co-chaperonin GroES (HSP10)
MTTWVPTKDKIIVKPYVRKLSSIIAISNKEAQNMGQVIAVGPGRKLPNGRFEENPIKVGSFVRFGTMSNDSKGEYLKYVPIEHEGENCLLMSWQDICWEQDEPFEEQNV